MSDCQNIFKGLIQAMEAKVTHIYFALQIRVLGKPTHRISWQQLNIIPENPSKD